MKNLIFIFISIFGVFLLASEIYTANATKNYDNLFTDKSANNKLILTDIAALPCSNDIDPRTTSGQMVGY